MKKISFEADPIHLDAFPHPVRANKLYPDYIKNISPFSQADNIQSGTVKKCIPFLDAASAGFIIPAWSDIEFVAEGDSLKINFPQNLPMTESLGQHSIDQISGHPLQDVPYGDMPLKFINPWIVKTAPGYSCLFTSPLNHLETRIKILDGVVDTDTYYNQVNFPFLYTGGEGRYLIKKGTPLVQVIPFKRENWNNSWQVKQMDNQKRIATSAKLSTLFYDAYKRLFWHKNT